MAASSHSARLTWRMVVAQLLALGAPVVGAYASDVRPSAQLPISIDAQSQDYDLDTHQAIWHKVKISQGSNSVSADQAQANAESNGQTTDLNFDNTHWVFHGNVKIITAQGQMSSDDADVTFAKKLLSKAIITGKPASFEQRGAKTGRPIQGRAETIEYDLAKGTVLMTKNAWLSDGPDEIHGDMLKYNIIEKKVVAESAEQSQRVHIVITPPPATPKP
jgi:lipopolysaccharide export system protein LptA